MKTVIEETADGSHTLFVPRLDEHYHSVNGAIQESNHVFIETGLHHLKKKEIRVFEVGFGTGLNSFLTFLDAKANGLQIDYTSIELYPLDEKIVSQLNYPEKLSPQDSKIFGKIHSSDWNERIKIAPNFCLTKIKSDLVYWRSVDVNFDLVFYDAFAPDKQPEMWTQPIFDKLFDMMAEGGIFVTYCAKGVVRRMLQTSGFTVERLPGPPGKREMLRAAKS